MTLPPFDVRIMPGKLRGTIKAVPSKSDAHRQLICAALSREISQIKIGDESLSDDILVTMACLRQMGAEILKKGAGEWQVRPVWGNQLSNQTIDCGESGSTLRFLLPVLAALGIPAKVTGRGRLPERPLSPLREELIAHGSRFDAPSLPFTLSGQLESGVYTLPGNISSQYVSGLLFALPLLKGDSSIQLASPLESADYVEMTLRTLEQFGVRVERRPDGYDVPGGQIFRSSGNVETEGDWSGAAFFLTAGALGADIMVCGLQEESRQPDRTILKFLRDFGAEVRFAEHSAYVRQNVCRPMQIDASFAPDLVPILSILACGAIGETVIFNAERLRLKESDRLQAMCDCINALGGEAAGTRDGMRVLGSGRLTGGEVDGQNDHRIVMAAAVAASICSQPVRIAGAEAVKKVTRNSGHTFIRWEVGSMSFNFGRNLKVALFGQSHSDAIGVVIDGLPAGRKIDFEAVARFMARRAPEEMRWRRRGMNRISRKFFPALSMIIPAVLRWPR